MKQFFRYFMSFFQTGKRCRPVLCQSAKTLVDGRCQYVTEMVYDADFVVNLAILPSSNISLIEKEYVLEELFNHIDLAWGHNWYIQEVSVSTYLSSQIETILLTLIYHSNGRG